jgi:hypothetical protein
MKIKTAELKGKALDWVLAVVLAKQHDCQPMLQDGVVWMPTKSIVFGVTNTEINGNNHIVFCHDYSHMCFMLIKENIYKVTATHGGWEVFGDDGQRQFSDTSLEEAVARCVVQMRLGDEVEVPSELSEVQS